MFFAKFEFNSSNVGIVNMSKLIRELEALEEGSDTTVDECCDDLEFSPKDHLVSFIGATTFSKKIATFKDLYELVSDAMVAKINSYAADAIIKATAKCSFNIVEDIEYFIDHLCINPLSASEIISDSINGINLISNSKFKFTFTDSSNLTDHAKIRANNLLFANGYVNWLDIRDKGFRALRKSHGIGSIMRDGILKEMMAMGLVTYSWIRK
jgi:hypothetical protein